MSSDSKAAAENFFVARQPIFDRNQRPCAFEILFRSSGNAKEAGVFDPDQATLQMIAEGFALSQDNGMSKPVFINFTEKMILEGHAYALPPNKCVVEILEDIEPTQEILKALKNLKIQGYKLALDDFIGGKSCLPYLKLVDIIKVDCLGLHGDVVKLKKLSEVIGKKLDCQLLAEKVEDSSLFEVAKESGYSLFQGFFFSKPKIIEGKRVSSSEVSKLRLLEELGKPDFDVKRLTKIFYADSSLSYRLFRHINSAGVGLQVQVKTLERAITLLGQRQLIQWLRVLILSDLAASKHTEEIIFYSVQRGKFLELLTAQGKTHDQPEAMFIMGMFSLLEEVDPICRTSLRRI